MRTNNEIIEEYLSTIKRDMTVSTYKTYKANMVLFAEWINDNHILAVSRDDLLEFRHHIINSGRQAASINIVLASMRSLYRYLSDKELVNFDVSMVKNVRNDKELKRAALSKEQIKAVIYHLSNDNSLNGSRNRALFLLMLSNGLRISEAASARIQDITMHNGTHILYLKRKGMIGRDKYVKLSNKTYLMLMEHIEDRTSGPMFVSSKGGPLNVDSISKIIKKLFRDAGIDETLLTANSLRHTYSYLAMEAGADIFALAQSLNHKHISSTQQYLESFKRSSSQVETLIEVDY